MIKANRLREIRKEQQMSQAELAAKVGTAPTYISWIERYYYYPGPYLRQRIAQALGVEEKDIWPDN